MAGTSKTTLRMLLRLSTSWGVFVCFFVRLNPGVGKTNLFLSAFNFCCCLTLHPLGLPVTLDGGDNTLAVKSKPNQL